MCIAIFKPADQILDKARLEFAFEQNGDGAGFAFAHKGKLTIEKGFFTFKKFWKAFDKIQAGNPAIVHFRIATSGAKDEANCHPFYVNDNVAVAHNGRLNDWTPNEKDKSNKSDTRYFVEGCLKPVLEDAPTAYLSPIFKFILEKTIESGNKMIFLDAQGRHGILREYVGEWIDAEGDKNRKGCWFSNDTYKVARQKPKELSEEEMDAIEAELAEWHEGVQKAKEEKKKKGKNFKYPNDKKLRIYEHEMSPAEQAYLDHIVSNPNMTPQAKAVQAYLSISDPSRSDFRAMMS